MFLQIIGLVMLLASCGEETGFVEKETAPTMNYDSSTEVKQSEGQNVDEVDQEGWNVVRFTQRKTEAVDILWVIDNSGSMSPLQKSLRENFRYFIQKFHTTDLDYHIGITSTDACHAKEPGDIRQIRCPEQKDRKRSHRGDLVGKKGKRVIKKGDDDVVSRFQKYADLGINGSAFEHGLTGAQLALNKSIGGLNEDFLRKGSFLSIIAITDEEDDGVGLAKTNENGVNYHEKNATSYSFTAEDFSNYLKKYIAPDHRYGFSAIGGTLGDDGKPCEYSGGRAYEDSAEYRKMAKKTGGFFESICDENWAEKLERIGDDILRQIDSVSLDNPDPESIEVRVNSRLFAAWHFNEKHESVEFDEIPEAGSKIEIRYLQAED